MSELEVVDLTKIAPDAIDPYVGYKYLACGDDGHLHSVAVGPTQKWVAGKRNEALCHGHGFYAWEALRKSPDKDYNVATAVAMGTPPAQWWNPPLNQWVTTTQMPSVMFSNPPDALVEPKTRLPEGYSWYFVKQPHDVVAEGCTCGFYVVDSPSYCENYSGDQKVLVEVALWGRVIKATHGARGQYAYPKAIYGTKKNMALAIKAGELYGVPVISLESETSPIFDDFRRATFAPSFLETLVEARIDEWRGFDDLEKAVLAVLFVAGVLGICLLVLSIISIV